MRFRKYLSLTAGVLLAINFACTKKDESQVKTDGTKRKYLRI